MNKQKVLFVDDDQFTHFEISRKLIGIYNISLISCYTPEEAVELMKSICFDTILIDYRFPGSKMDGIDLAKEAKNLKYKPKVIIVSGAERNDIKKMCENQGFYADGYVSKNIISEQFKELFLEYRINP